MRMSGSDQKFMRPLDVTATRRNRHRVRATKILVFLANLFLVTSLVAGGFWLLRRVQEDERFAIRSIEIEGVAGEHRAEMTDLLDRWIGANLFRLEMGEIRHDLVTVEWVDDVAVEKMLPDRLRVRIVERVPQALISWKGELRFIDDDGVPFGEVDAGAEARFPTVEANRGREARRCVKFLEELERSDPALHSRVARIRPAGTAGWEIVDRDLGTIVRVGDDSVVEKWRLLYGILDAERVPGSAIRYADLRFDDQIVIGHDERVVQE